MLEKIVKFFFSQAHTIADDLCAYRQQLYNFKSLWKWKQHCTWFLKLNCTRQVNWISLHND